MKKHRPLTLGFVLAITSPLHAAVSFVDNFDTYATGGPNAAFDAAYNRSSAPTISASTGLGGSQSLQNGTDMVLNRKDTAINLTTVGENSITLDLFFQHVSATGVARPHIGLMPTNSQLTFSSGTELSARIGGNNWLEIRSNGSELFNAGTATLSLTVGNWYDLRATITRTATTNQFNMLVELYNSSNTGVVGTLVSSLSNSTAITNAAMWTDTEVFAALRENSSIVNIDRFSVVQVPEPNAAALLGGLGAFALLRRRRIV